MKDFHFPADERPSCKSGASFWLKGNRDDDDDDDFWHDDDDDDDDDNE